MTLPPELLLEIFKYLPAEDLLDSIQHVCTRWRELAQYPSLWENYVYKPDEIIGYDEAIKFMEKCPMVRHIQAYLHTYDHPDVPEKVVNAAIKNCIEIHTFSVKFDWDNFTLTHINALFEAFPNIEVFEITVDGPEDNQIVDRISQSTKLKQLTVKGRYHCDDMLKPIVDYCISLNHLSITEMVLPEKEQLYVLENMKDRLTHVEFCESQPATDQVVKVLGNFTKLETVNLTHKGDNVNFLPLGNVKTLKCLTFRSMSQNMSNFDTIFDVLFCNPFPLLQKLTIMIENCSCERTILKYICQCYPNLKYLYLHKSTEGMNEKFEEMSRLEQLESLVYCNNTVTTNDAKHIAQCHKLKHLDLSSSYELTDTVVANLANCKLLESLSLSYCPLTGHSLYIVSEHFKKLKILNIHDINAATEGMTILAEKMPWLKIHY